MLYSRIWYLLYISIPYLNLQVIHDEIGGIHCLLRYLFYKQLPTTIHM